MAASGVMLSLPQMIDLSLSSPECGSVNFNLLRSLLHVIVQQLELVQCKIEFRGKDGERMSNLMSTTKSENTLKLTEYVISPAKHAGKVIKGKKSKKGGKPSKKPSHEEAGEADLGVIGSDESLETVVLVEPSADTGESYSPCLISQKHLEEMEQEIKDLKDKVLELAEMPKNEALIDALRNSGVDKGTPVLDMFQMMTLSKRIEATENGVGKLASMVEDLAKHSPSTGSGGGNLTDTITNLQDRLANIENFMDSGGATPLTPGKGAAAAAGGAGGTGVGGGASSTVPGAPKIILPDLDTVVSGTVETEVPDLSKVTREEFASTVREELKKIKKDLKLVYNRLGMLFGLGQEYTPEEILAGIKNCIKKYKASTAEGGLDTSEMPPGERIEQLEDRFNGTNEQIASLDSTFNNEITNLHAQFAEMEKSFGNIMEKIHFGLPGGDGPVGGETAGELYDKLLNLQQDMENVAETANKLMEDKEDKQRLLDVLSEQIEFLKTVKADKEDLEDALADKADACAINRKVSHDQFDTACDELSRGIEEALGKLTQQEELWQQALDEIQKEIGNKLDRMELGPLRDFVNNKLKMLQQRLKALTALKKETEAAGTKKFLRNVNCISCDKDVVMRKEMDPSLLPQPYAMPPTKSMGPYLAYELDALRKQQKSLPISRNLNHFESALAHKSPRPGEDHICNRYCGGSHTITTPQQRVTRLGHFLNQWGPEAQAVSDIKTKDKDEDKLTIVGHSNVIQQVIATSPRTSKTEGMICAPCLRPYATDANGTRRASACQTQLLLQQEKRPSSGSVEKKTSKLSEQKLVSPKPATESGDKARRPSVSTGSQRASMTSATAKRPSQVSAKSLGSGPQNEKAGSRLSAGIPEETASEIANEEEAPAEVQSSSEVTSGAVAGNNADAPSTDEQVA